MSCCSSFSAANTGRSGQPMQNCGGRAGSGAPSAFVTACAPRSVASSHALPRPIVDAGRCALDECGEAPRDDLDRVLPRHRQDVLAVHRGRHVVATQDRENLLLDEFGLAFLDDEHRALAGAELRDLAPAPAGT